MMCTKQIALISRRPAIIFSLCLP